MSSLITHHSSLITHREPAARVKTISTAWPRDAVIITFLLALQCVYFTGIIASDDMNYLNLVHHVQAHEQVSPELNYFVGRFVYWRLLQAVVTVFPTKPWALAIPSLLATFATFLLLRAFAKRYLDPKMSHLPMLIYGLIPVVIVNASVALPDPVAALLAWTGVYLAAHCLLDRDMPHGVWRLPCAGALIAISYNAKETTLALIPCMVLFVLLNKTRQSWAWKRAVGLALGAICWLVIEAIWMAAWTGDPQFHFHAVVAAHEYSAPVLHRDGSSLMQYWLDYPRWLLDPRSEIGPLGPVMLATLICAAIKRTPITNLLLCLIVPSVVYLITGSVNVFHYQPVVHQQRYLLPLLPGMALLTAAMLQPLCQRIQQSAPSSKKRIATACLFASVTIACVIAPNTFAARWYNAATFSAGYDLTKTTASLRAPDARVYATALTRNRFVNLNHWLAVSPVELLASIPQSPDGWLRAHAGDYILTSRTDRQPIPGDKHTPPSLYGPPLAALAQFEHIAHQEPPKDCLRTLLARMTGQPIPTDSQNAVDLWHIPSRR